MRLSRSEVEVITIAIHMPCHAFSAWLPTALKYIGVRKWWCNAVATGLFEQPFGESWSMGAGVACVTVSMAMNCRTGVMVVIFSTWVVLFSCSDVIAAGEDDQLKMVASGDQPKRDVKYYHLWASQDGETHFTKCTMHGFNLIVYTNVPFPQYLKSDFGGGPLKMVFSELPVGMVQPLHSPPEVQFVVTLSGSWYIETSDGTRHEFREGDVMFQDNTKTSPADNRPEHYSGTVGDEPCHQLLVQFSRPPQVDNPCPF